MRDGNSVVDRAVHAALNMRGPMEVELHGGGWLVVHPQADFVMLTVGQREGHADAVGMLQQRLATPERFGLWLPATLNNDSPIAVQRLERLPGGGVAPFEDAWLAQARELLA